MSDYVKLCGKLYGEMGGPVPAPCLCGSTDTRIRSGEDINYPSPRCWFVARVMCGKCGSGGAIARCSDEPAAREGAVRLWREFVGVGPMETRCKRCRGAGEVYQGEGLTAGFVACGECDGTGKRRP